MLEKPIKTDNNPKSKVNDNKPLNAFEQRKKMLEQKGIMGGPRPSAPFIMPHGFGAPMPMNNNAPNMQIIKEESDKQKPGYNPTDDLEKKLEKVVVVQKDKKKKKKPIFQD